MVSRVIKIAYLQLHLAWEDWEANTRQISRLIDGMGQDVDIILLPEMFGSGFTMEPGRVAQPMSGPVVQWMSTLALKKDCHVMGSLVIEEEGKFYNRLINAGPTETVSFYDKRHLFSLAGEDEKYTAGNHRLIDTIKGWRICPLVCYDLRFPVWSRNDIGYDILVYVVNWPEPRIDAWRTLLKARAIENQCYVVGVNRVGRDQNEFNYVGASSAFDMSGGLIHQSGPDEELHVLEFHREPLGQFRRAYNFLADKDSYSIQ